MSCCCVGGEDRRASRVADDGHATAAWRRLAGERLRRVEQLLERVDAGDAGARQHQFGDIVGGSQCRGVRHRSAGPRWTSTGLDRDDRLGPARRGRRSARTSSGCRTTPGTARSPTSRCRSPSTAAGRCRRCRPCCRPRRNSRCRCRGARSRRSGRCPSAPDCVMNATLPGIGSTGANVAFIRTSVSVLASPMQFGPITRMPYFLADFTRPASTARPSAPSSANPALMITMPPTCAAPHSAITAATASAGTAMMARSGGIGVSPTLAYAWIPPIDAACGIDGQHGAGESAAHEVVDEFVADRAGRAAGADDGDRAGLRMRRIDATTAARSRSSMCSSSSADGANGKLTSMTPLSNWLVTLNPAWRKTSIIARLSGSVSASKRSMPLLRATAARCSSITVASPRRC